MLDEDEKRRLKVAAVRKAMGYTATEVTEEYAVRDGEETLVRRKVVQKDVPPYFAAVKWLMGEQETEEISLEELERERAELEEAFLRNRGCAD